MGVGANALSALLLTHLHSNHIAGLGDLIITRWMTTLGPASLPLPIIGPPGTKTCVDATLAAFGADIGYRIAHHADPTEPPALDVQEYSDGRVWDRDGVRITSAPTDHRPVAPTIGFRVEHAGASVLLAGDTAPCASLDDVARGADALVHTAIRKDVVIHLPQQRIRDICDYHSSVEEAAATAARAGVGTLILTHYVPPIPPDQQQQWRALAASAFNGPIEIGQDLHRVQVGAGMSGMSKPAA